MTRDDGLFSLGVGPIAAIGLAVVLIPLRELTTASNLAFAFLALTIVVGHAGGRWPATATAITSAISLNFFLTRPYLTLTIHGRDDVIAFLGLATCGLISAALGSARERRLASRRQLAVLYSAARDLELGGPPASRVQALLESACAAFPVTALAVRDETGQLLAFAGDRTRLAAIPEVATDSDLLEDTGAVPWRVGASSPLPAAGLRLPLVVGHRPLGSLDLWGDGRPAGRETKRTLRAVARAAAALLGADRARVSTGGDPERPASAWAVLPHGGVQE